MRARATTIRCSVSARARSIGTIHGRAMGLGGLHGRAELTDRVNIGRWLHVTPETPQQLVWLVPQYGIDYEVTTSSKFDWNIE